MAAKKSLAKNRAAVALGKRRWAAIPPGERSAMVPRNGGGGGGRPRKYPQCPRYAAHRFTDDRCPCGYTR